MSYFPTPALLQAPPSPTPMPKLYFFFCFEHVLGSVHCQTHAGDLRTKQDNKIKSLDSQIL